MAISEDLEVAVRVSPQNPNQIGVHEGLAAQESEEAVSVLLGVIDQRIHVVETDHMLRFVDVHPAALTPKIAAIGNRNIEERREGDPLLEAFLKPLDRPHALVPEVVGEFPQNARVR